MVPGGSSYFRSISANSPDTMPLGPRPLSRCRGASAANEAYDSPVSINVGIDQGVDLKALQRIQEQGIIELRQANELEQTWDPNVTQQEGFMPDHSRLGGPD